MVVRFQAKSETSKKHSSSTALKVKESVESGPFFPNKPGSDAMEVVDDFRNHAAILQKKNPFNNKQVSQQKDFDEGKPPFFCMAKRMPF